MTSHELNTTKSYLKSEFPKIDVLNLCCVYLNKKKIV